VGSAVGLPRTCTPALSGVLNHAANAIGTTAKIDVNEDVPKSDPDCPAKPVLVRQKILEPRRRGAIEFIERADARQFAIGVTPISRVQLAGGAGGLHSGHGCVVAPGAFS